MDMLNPSFYQHLKESCANYHQSLSAMQVEQSQLAHVLSYYQTSLYHNEKAVSYLQYKRGIDEDTIEHFQLGFCDRTLGKTLGDSRKSSSALIRGTLERVGFVAISGHERFRGAIVFPVIVDGDIVGATGRRISRVIKSDSTAYPCSPYMEEYFYHQSCINECSTVVLCHSPMEVVSAWQLGISNVLAPIGDGNLNAARIATLNQANVTKVILVASGGTVRQEQVKRNAYLLKEAGIHAVIVCLPGKVDINELLCRRHNAADILNSLLQSNKEKAHG